MGIPSSGSAQSASVTIIQIANNAVPRPPRSVVGVAGEPIAGNGVTGSDVCW